jgi:phosphatidylserine/phosphatidylglycerophosphate/cardiolipin synthase-like enzyme
MSMVNDKKAQVEDGKKDMASTRSWYLEEKDGAWARRSNTSIKPLICGEETFKAIETAIRQAKESIEIVTWGFDPSLRLQGSAVTTAENCTTIQQKPSSRLSCLPYTGEALEANPRIGDLLLAAAKNKVQVRILVWNDTLARLLRVDENLPESGADGNGIDPPVYRTLWKMRLAAGNDLMYQAVTALRDAEPPDYTDKELSRRLRAEADRRLKSHGEVLEHYKRHYAEAFTALRDVRGNGEEESSWWKNGTKYPAQKTLQEIRKGFARIYGKGYTRPPLNIIPLDSPGTQIDDHYYNAEWFRLVRGTNRAAKTGEVRETAPDFIENIKIEYRSQNRSVDGGKSPAMQRINRVANRLEFLIPKLQKNELFLASGKYMELFWLWWSEDEFLRPSSAAFAADQKMAFGNTLTFLKSHDYSNLYGVRDYISQQIGDILRYPMEWLGDAIKSFDKIQKLTEVVNLFTAQGVRTLAATYHQKTVLIDYKSKKGKAVGFVMGHNMLKNYMDGVDHKMFGSSVRYPEFGPWQDISLQVRGACLEDIANNFVESWADGSSGPLDESNLLDESGKGKISGMAQVLRTALTPGGVPPGYPDVSLEAINEDLAAELEEICNLLEKLLGVAKTDFTSLTDIAQKQLARAGGGFAARADEAFRKTEEAAADARNMAADGLRKIEDAVRQGYERARETAQTALQQAENTLNALAPVSPGASPSVRGSDAVSIYNSYLNAIRKCSIFLYTENQYFRHECIAREVRRRALEHVKENGQALHWFVVTNHPVSPGEAPNTAKMLEALGQHERLGKYVREPYEKKMLRERYQSVIERRKKIKDALEVLEDPPWYAKSWNSSPVDLNLVTNGEQIQEKMARRTELEIENENLLQEMNKLEHQYPSISTYGDDPKTIDDVEEREDAFKTSDLTVGDLAEGAELEEMKAIGLKEEAPCLKVHVATLTSCHPGDPCMYTPIYVHSKLFIVDDAFMTSGSANINIKSMHLDAEINIATDSNNIAAELRKKLFEQHTDENLDTIEKNYEYWSELMDTNWGCMHNGAKLTGFLTHFYDPETPVARPTD